MHISLFSLVYIHPSHCFTPWNELFTSTQGSSHTRSNSNSRTHALDSAQGAASNCSSLTEFEVRLQSYEEETETKLAVLQSDKV